MAVRASTKGKQPSVQEGSFLLFLRSVGYKDELPPSTVAWLENAPVFRFMASRLSQDNFISPEDQQEYNEILLAKGPNLELYEALGDSASDDDAENDAEQQPPRQEFLDETAPADLQQQVQEWEQYVQHAEQQIAMLRDVSSRVEASVRSNRNQQSKYLTLQAQAQRRLNALKADVTDLNQSVNKALSGLADVCSQLTELLQEMPAHWLLTASDLSQYQQQDVVARQVFERAMRLLNAAGVVRELDPAASPTAVGPTPQHSKQDLSRSPLKPGFQSAVTTPQQHKQRPQQQQQQQQLSLLTPRGRTNREEARLEADVKRHADQEARNAALLRELTRQRLAFKLAYDELIKREVAEAGFKNQLAAIHDIRKDTGGFARYKKIGPEAVDQLSLEVTQLEERRQLLLHEVVPALTEDLARLNDTYIVARDYERQLHKMSVASERKQAVLRSLFGTASRHLQLLMVGSTETQRLLTLLEELKQTKETLEGHVDAIKTRVAGYTALQQSLQQSQHRSNLQPDDSYLMTLMAAADGSLALGTADADGTTLQQQQQQQLLHGSEGEPGTPLGAAVAAGQITPQSARTPGYVPVKQLTDQLQQLASTIQQSSSKLQQLCKDLPDHLEKQAAVDKRLYDLAYPAGQSCAPLVAVKSSSIPGSLHGGNSGWGLGSTIGSSAAPSLRSMSVRSTSSSANSSSVVGQHPLPLLRVPEVAEQQVALEKSIKQLGNIMHGLVSGVNDQAKLFNQNKQEREAEKKVMSLFYTNPEKLSEYMTRLREEVAALELAQHI